MQLFKELVLHVNRRTHIFCRSDMSLKKQLTRTQIGGNPPLPPPSRPIPCSQSAHISHLPPHSPPPLVSLLLLCTLNQTQQVMCYFQPLVHTSTHQKLIHTNPHHTYTHRHTQTHTHTPTHACTHTHTHTPAHTQTHTHAHAHRERERNTHASTHIQTPTHTQHTHTPRTPHTQHTNTRIHTHTQSHARTNTHTHTHTTHDIPAVRLGFTGIKAAMPHRRQRRLSGQQRHGANKVLMHP